MGNLRICPVLLLCLAGTVAQAKIPTFLPTSDTTARPTTLESPLLQVNDDPTVLQGSLKYPNDTACLLYKMGVAVQVIYPTTDAAKIGFARFALPSDTKVSGTCGTTSAALRFSFNNGTYNVSLDFTSDGEQFEVSASSVGWVFDSTNFPNASAAGESAVRNDTQGDLGLFRAPLGQSYLCRSEDSEEITVDVMLFFVEVQVQPFDVTAGKYGQPLVCKKDMPTTAAPTTKIPTTAATNTTTAPNTTLAPTTTALPVMNTTTVPGTTASPPTHRGKWQVRNKNSTCLLAYMAMRFEAQYKTKEGEIGTATVWFPTYATAVGSCSEEHSVIELRSDVSNLTINFQKAPGKKNWSTSSILFSYWELPEFFMDTANPYTLHTMRLDINLFMTDSGQSYKCDTEISVPLKDRVTLKISQLQVQAFDVQGDKFGTPQRCPADLPPTPVPTMTPLCPHMPPPGKWVVKDEKGNPCLLADMSLQLRSRYTTVDNTTRVGCINVPTNADATGICGQNTSKLTLSFHVRQCNITFTFSESRENSSNPSSVEKFGVSQVSVEYFVNKNWFPDAKQLNHRMDVTTANLEIYEAHVGQSYQCMGQTNITLNTDVTLFTQDLHLQPFSVSGYGFAKSHVCPEDPTPEPSWKANVVPMAVGCALGAFVIVVTLGTYIVYRRRQKRMAGYSLLSTT
ncbi:lysosome-associated membrane glycoprotein 1-like [Branchiostoma floridae x Branchiostoma belcheri]